jgi:hypothetical protein
MDAKLAATSSPVVAVPPVRRAGERAVASRMRARMSPLQSYVPDPSFDPLESRLAETAT